MSQVSALTEYQDWCDVCERYTLQRRRIERLASVATLFGVPERVPAIECTRCHWVVRFRPNA
jgi:hypothetical protein